MVFAGYSGFLHYLQLASHELATIGINVTKNEIQIQINSSICYLPGICFIFFSGFPPRIGNSWGSSMLAKSDQHKASRQSTKRYMQNI